MMTKEDVQTTLIAYLQAGNPLFAKLDEIPLDKSLVELGLIDSFGVIDIVIFLEGVYKIQISDNEISKENFGSIEKISSLVVGKI